MAEAGQQIPIVVVAADAAYVVVDGHKRVRCLHRLQHDTVAAVAWDMREPDALIFRQLLHTDATDSAFEQAWLLRTLYEEHGLALDAISDEVVRIPTTPGGLRLGAPSELTRRNRTGTLATTNASVWHKPAAADPAGPLREHP